MTNRLPPRWTAWLCLLGCLLGGVAFGLEAVPQLARRVTDLSQTLDSATIQSLEQRLAAFEASHGSQIAVLMVPTTGEEEIAAYALRVVEQWKLGRKGVDDGVLVLLAKNDRRLRIEVGYGLEGVIPDAIAKRIIAETIAPRLRQGDFNGGVSAGVEQIMQVIQGEALPAPPPKQKSSSSRKGGIDIFGMIFGGIFVAALLSAFLGRPLGGLLAGLGVGSFIWFKLGLILALVATVVIFILAQLVGRGGGGGWSTGGGFFGGGSSDGGGFSGGGGSFGGGGASGSWD